jgi:hypothetical protein
MTLEKLRLTLINDGTTREYDIYPIQSVDDSQRKEAFSIAPPGLRPSQNILLGISGMQGDVSIDAVLWDNGEDRSNGTAPTSATIGYNASGTELTYLFDGTVVTVEDQFQYLKHVMQAPDFGAKWELEHLTGSKFNGQEVFLETVEPTAISQDSPKWKPVRFQIRMGGSV